MFGKLNEWWMTTVLAWDFVRDERNRYADAVKVDHYKSGKEDGYRNGHDEGYNKGYKDGKDSRSNVALNVKFTFDPSGKVYPEAHVFDVVAEGLKVDLKEGHATIDGEKVAEVVKMLVEDEWRKREAAANLDWNKAHSVVIKVETPAERIYKDLLQSVVDNACYVEQMTNEFHKTLDRVREVLSWKFEKDENGKYAHPDTLVDDRRIGRIG